MRKLAVVFALALMPLGTAQAQFCPGAAPYVFTDVLANDTFCGYITRMAVEGITQGCQIIDAKNRRYCPDDFVTRKQMSAFIIRGGDALFPLTCAAGQVMKWDGLDWTCANDATVGGGSNAYVFGGNGFGATAVLGTTDNNALDVRVNNSRVIRYEPNSISPNVIGGSPANNVTAGVRGATIAGGGMPAGDTDPDFDFEAPNRVTDAYGTVGGGFANRAGNDAGSTTDFPFATVGGGLGNTASGAGSTVGGGVRNIAGGLGNGNTVGGGYDNTASGSSSTVGGGWQNTASGTFSSTVGGGNVNLASGSYSTVSGGRSNTASEQYSTVGGGSDNTASGLVSTVGGGFGNRALGVNSTVGGGLANTASEAHSTVGGGHSNTASGYFGTVGGGFINNASGNRATVGGGERNTAGGDYSWAGGRRAKTQTADAIPIPHAGAFVWADNSGGDLASFNFHSTADNQFSARATGGVRFVTEIDAAGDTTWSCLAVAGASWACASDRNLKHGLVELNGREVLEKLAALPVYQWQPKGQNAHVLHYGPMAQDFHAAFGLGDDDKMIGMQDADGVALAAIQGLNAKLEARVAAKDAEIAALKREMAELRLAVEVLMARTTAEGRVAQTR